MITEIKFKRLNKENVQRCLCVSFFQEYISFFEHRDSRCPKSKILGLISDISVNIPIAYLLGLDLRIKDIWDVSEILELIRDISVTSLIAYLLGITFDLWIRARVQLLWGRAYITIGKMKATGSRYETRFTRISTPRRYFVTSSGGKKCSQHFWQSLPALLSQVEVKAMIIGLILSDYNLLLGLALYLGVEKYVWWSWFWISSVLQKPKRGV